jgi:methyl-accepting chemotaxis protein
VILVDNYKNLNEINKIKEVALVATKISALVHETQKERGMSAGYLGSKGKKFTTELPKQRELANKKSNDLKIVVSKLNKSLYSSEFNNSLKSAIEMFDNIKNIRDRVTSLNIPTKDAIGYYTKMNSKFLNTISVIAKLSNNASIAKELSAYSNYLLSKERAGIERAVGSNTFARDSFGNGMRTKLNNLIAEQNSYMDSFLKLATTEAKEFFKNTLNGKDVDEVNRMRKVMLDAKEVGGFGVEGTYWFDTITKKINLLKQTEDYITSKLSTNDKKLQKAIEISKYISALVHETQKERGNTAGYFGGKGKGKFVNRLKKQRELTDTKIANLKRELNKFNPKNYSKDFQSKLAKALNNLKEIEAKRTKVNDLSLGLGNALKYYTGMNASFLDTIATIIPMTKDAKTTMQLNTYYNFLMSKERAGIERAVLSNSFTRNKFVSGMKEKFIKLVTEQNSFLKSFLATADSNVIEYYHTKMDNPAVKEVDRMRAIAMSANTIGGFGEDATYWFKTITSKINKLKKVEDFLSKQLINNLENTKSDLISTMIIFSLINLIIIIFTLFFSLFVNRNIQNSLDIFEKGLLHFFKYLNKETTEATKIELNSKDELGKMVSIVNKNIENIEKSILKDNNLIQDATDVANKIAKGHFSVQIEQSGASAPLNELKSIINDMLRELDKNTKLIRDTLHKYIENDYRVRIDKKAEDRMQELFNDINRLADALEKNSEIGLENGLTLQKDSSMLEQNVLKLSSSMNQQSASLEETSASIEEILATLKENSHQATEMSNLATEVQNSSKRGTKLAHDTSEAMDEINNSTSMINEAIEAIDQIAFQTNILSLNAAVEAATAGEAGKGFAVVAGEVRNLANRSAETAKDIKELVEKATHKTDFGKNISQTMVKEYNELNTHINDTLGLINSVSESIVEQHSNIEHISKAVSELDKTTQQTVTIANKTNAISKETLSMADKLVENSKNSEFKNKDKILSSIEIKSYSTQIKSDNNQKDTEWADF